MHEAPTEYYVCGADEIEERGRLLIEVGGQEIDIFKVNGEYYAYENRCLHQGGPVCRGQVLGRWQEKLDDRGRVVTADFSTTDTVVCCPWHGWTYDLETGRNIADARLALRSFQVAVRGGDVYVTVARKQAVS